MTNTKINNWTKSILCAAMIGAIGAGCVMKRNPEPSALNPEPIPLDPAMQARQWEQSSAVYESVSVLSKPTLFLLDSAPGQPEYRYALIETPIFFANLFMMPYAAFRTPALETREYRLESIGPTYTGNPPLPPEPEPEQSDPTEPPEMPDEPMPSERPMDEPLDTPVPEAPTPEAPTPEAPDRPLQFVEPDTTPTAAPTTQPTFNK